MKSIKENDLKQGIYIPNIECCWLYKAHKECDNYEVEKQYLDKLLNGKIDWSFELIENKELINNINIQKIDNKLYTLDIVNVKYIKKYKDKQEEKTTKQLRDWSYSNGFVFNNNKMLNWKRSSGKARVGQNLFILDSIRDKCLEWARMGLTFDDKLDIGSIRAYESLPLSSIIGFIEINPKSILVVNDYKSIFPWKMSMTWLKNGQLKTSTDIHEECNSIWDGECLLSNTYFEKYDFLNGKGVALLRNRYMKSAGFCCYIEKFYRNYCSEYELDYETFEIEDMYHNKIKVKDIKLITTPSSIKMIKYKDDKIINNNYTCEGGWLKYWIDNCINTFGVCKTESPSRLCIFDEDKNVILHRNVLSYQMVNTIPFTKHELKELVKPEIQYVERLKNDLQFFLQEVNQSEPYIGEDEVDDNENGYMKCGSNIDVIQAFIELSKKNEDFTRTQVFKDYRRNFINSYINKLRQGKILIDNADYCIACGNPYELLMSTVGEFKGKSLTLQSNELYCTRFKDGQDVVGFRNPSINCGNIGIQVNRVSDKIHEYMNDTPNIVYLNSVDYPILSTYQGEDFDIDSNLLITNPIIIKACSRIDKNITAIPVNCIKNSGKNDRELTPQNMSDVDHIISQNYIGSTINLSQEVNSIMNHAKYNKLINDNELSKLYDMTSKLSSISCCEIDKAKKQFEDLNVLRELDRIKNDMELVDNIKICFVNHEISELKHILQQKKKQIQKYRTNKRKPYNSRKREINKVLNDKNNKISDIEIEQLNKELQDIEHHIRLINNEKQYEINSIKKSIANKHKQLSTYDTRRIKPYFFKFIGDNDTKAQKRTTNKKHRKMLDNQTIKLFAKENNIKVENINIKDKELVKLLKLNSKKQSEWENSIYRKLDTPMDWLEEEIDKIKNSKKVGTIQVVQLLKRDTNKWNRNNVKDIIKILYYTHTKIKAYQSNVDLEYNNKLPKIATIKTNCIKYIRQSSVTQSDIYHILIQCLTSVRKIKNKKTGKNYYKIDKKSDIESLTLELLFKSYGDKLLKIFVSKSKTKFDVKK